LPESVVIVTSEPVTTLDPYLMVASTSGDSIAAHVWDTLTWLDENLTVQPRLAESWRLVNDLTWEISLRPGVVFHNGEPFKATAAAFSLRRTGELAGGLQTFSDDVSLDSVEIVDDDTVRIHTTKPVVDVPYYLTHVEMLPPDYYGQASVEELIGQPVGTGPYRFSGRNGPNELILTANADYWQGKAPFETLTYRFVPDLNQNLPEFSAEETTLVAGLSPQQLALADEAGWQVGAVESTKRLFIGIKGGEDGPLADARVQHALNYAIDVEAIVADHLGGYGQRYGKWSVQPGEGDDQATWSYNPVKARELLAEAGYPDGFETTLDAPLGRYHNDQVVTQAIVEQLVQVGVIVEVQSYDWPTYVEQHLLPGDVASLYLLGLNSRGNTLEDLSTLSIAFPFNPLDWRNPAFSSLLIEARQTFNQGLRARLLNEAETIVAKEAPMIWLWRQYDFYAFTPDLVWTPRPDGLIYLYQPGVVPGAGSE
jgi:peptide/nickel transport system substrate-binding protein